MLFRPKSPLPLLSFQRTGHVDNVIMVVFPTDPLTRKLTNYEAVLPEKELFNLKMCSTFLNFALLTASYFNMYNYTCTQQYATILS